MGLGSRDSGSWTLNPRARNLGSWRPGSQMGLFGPLFGGFERCLRGVSLGYGRLDLSGVPQIGPQNGPFRPSGTSDLGLAMFNTRISYDTNVSERG